MADQCIVCLENLDVQPPPAAPEPALHVPLDTHLQQKAAPGSTSPSHATNGSLAPAPTFTTTLTCKPAAVHSSNNNDSDDSNRVAVIDVCGHTLHDACLREWSGKANSCPICRQVFHLVHVYDHVGGSKLHSYKVEDKKQIAEFDPQAWLDENPEHEEEPRPCPICNQSDHEEVLLLCDSCDAPYHTYCVGLDSVPRGHWFCMECTEDGADLLAQQLEDPAVAAAHLAGSSDHRSDYLPRTQATMRRVRRRARSDEWQGAWGQLTGHVWDALSIDLDNDDDDDESLANYRRSRHRREHERREYQRWQQRLNIATRLGAHDVFASNLPHALSRPIAQPPPPPPEETGEEKEAWTAFEKVMETNTPAQSTPNTRKRRRSRSVTASPVEPPQAERKLKRPRTRRVPTQSEGSSSKATTSAAPQQHHQQQASTSSRPAAGRTQDSEMPSFLSNLLKEVEVGTSSEDETIRVMLGNTRSAPDPSSPATSPAASAYSSPRALSLTPPPQRAIGDRVGSPLSLSSYIEPIYPPANFSPTRNGSPSRNGSDHSDSENRSRQHSVTHQQSQNKHSAHQAHQQHHRQQQKNGNVQSLEIRQPRPRRQAPSNVTTSLVLSPEAVSPTRMNLPFETKESISGIVKNALKPHWKSGHITADQYAVINRDLSRKLYEEVSLERSLTEDARQRCEKIASKEVSQAVSELKA
ncbi:hypothetical protein Micbo1qcDRAFT_45666 [Microdochium bolleyi]|uniref:PHD and RING finger domain-containing protein n=1 Tax=Microdochium bolleyi TaxID=196109 RepID=A0A136JBY2_9PEZI|nr:hypothetical protein Micbo1qcDRAFT_45666 [Microdochium bolleyi]